MGLLLNVIKTNTMDDRPILSLSNCVNRNQKHLACSACMDICPKGVYDREQKVLPKWDECQNCGLCVTACKTRCIAPSPVNAKRHLLLANKQGEIALSCSRAEKQTGHVEECLALLPWEYLAYLALGGKLILNLKPCKTCPHEDCRELLEDQLLKLRAFLGEERFVQHVCQNEEGCEEKTNAKQEDVSRRDFLRSMMLGGKKTTALVVGDIAGSKIDAMIYRRMLARRVRTMAGEDERFSCRMNLPRIKDACYGCGICALLCPNGAIEIGQEENGVRNVYITPHKCTGCGVCKAVCREGCIEDIREMQAPHLGRLVLNQVESASCEDCGRALDPRKGEKLCILCRKKKRK